MKQYEIWWASLPEPVGVRPVLLLSRDGAYRYLDQVIVVEITTQIRGIAPELTLGLREGLPRRSVANFDQLRRVARSRLTERLGRLPAGRVIEAKRALGHTLGWPELAVLG